MKKFDEKGFDEKNLLKRLNEKGLMKTILLERFDETCQSNQFDENI